MPVRSGRTPTEAHDLTVASGRRPCARRVVRVDDQQRRCAVVEAGRVARGDAEALDLRVEWAQARELLQRRLAPRVLVELEGPRAAVRRPGPRSGRSRRSKRPLVGRSRGALVRLVRPTRPSRSRVTSAWRAVFHPTVIDMSNAGASGVSGWLGDIHGCGSGCRAGPSGCAASSRGSRCRRRSRPCPCRPGCSRPPIWTAVRPDAQWRFIRRPGTFSRPSRYGRVAARCRRRPGATRRGRRPRPHRDPRRSGFRASSARQVSSSNALTWEEVSPCGRCRWRCARRIR